MRTVRTGGDPSTWQQLKGCSLLRRQRGKAKGAIKETHNRHKFKPFPGYLFEGYESVFGVLT
jgi:hypothetical protein